jgi:hypothetical protein
MPVRQLHGRLLSSRRLIHQTVTTQGLYARNLAIWTCFLDDARRVGFSVPTIFYRRAHEKMPPVVSAKGSGLRMDTYESVKLSVQPETESGRPLTAVTGDHFDLVRSSRQSQNVVLMLPPP